MNQTNIFDLLTPETAENAAELPELDVAELEAYRCGKLVLRPNYVHLGWHKGGSNHRTTVFSSKESRVDRREAAFKQQTVYVISVPLPEAWLKDESLHSKAQLLEKKILEGLGFHIERRYREQDFWEVIDKSKAEAWKVENCLCPDCRYLHVECRCNLQTRIEEPKQC